MGKYQFIEEMQEIDDQWIECQKSNKSYICPYCNRFFDHKNNFRKHIRVHTGERPYSCSLCPFSANQKVQLTKHLFNKHYIID